jgi:hypothetical protein
MPCGHNRGLPVSYEDVIPELATGRARSRSRRRLGRFSIAGSSASSLGQSRTPRIRTRATRSVRTPTAIPISTKKVPTNSSAILRNALCCLRVALAPLTTCGPRPVRSLADSMRAIVKLPKPHPVRCLSLKSDHAIRFREGNRACGIKNV